MMPHEYEREIRMLKERFGKLEAMVQSLCKLADNQAKLDSTIKDCVEMLTKEVKELKANSFRVSSQRKEIDRLNDEIKETHGQTNPQSTERPEKKYQRHKRASKDGQEV